MRHSSGNLIAKILVIGMLMAVLVFLFHPGIGRLSLIINGEPVAQPMVRLAAIPTMLLVLAFSIFLGLLIFFGVGLLVFAGALLLSLLGILLIAPYFWPVLLILFLVIALMSIGGSDKSKP